MTDATTIDIPVPGITWEKITDQICAALEGGSNYWLQCFKPQVGRERATKSPWYSDQKVWSGEFIINCRVLDDDNAKIHLLDRQKVINGLNWLAAYHSHRVFEIVEETGDAETGDVFLQACLFGEIVYG
jgi:hypothetical protein